MRLLVIKYFTNFTKSMKTYYITYYIELNILRFIKLMKKMNDSDNEFGATRL